MKTANLNKTFLIVAGLTAPVLSLGGCAVDEGSSAPIGKTRQAFGVVQPREHHEFIDDDGLFVTYWERSNDDGDYVYGDVEMNTFSGGYQSTADFSMVTEITNPNNVTGKGKAQCWGDVIDWTVAENTGVTSMRVYGWFEDPLVEYYIGRPGGRAAGTYTLDTAGGMVEYELQVMTLEQENILNPEGVPGLPLKFLQYNVEVKSGAHPTEGPIDLSQHFAAWESIMAVFWPAQTDWISGGWEWNPLTRANYCVVATEIWGVQVERTARVENITVTEAFPQLVDGSCNNFDNDDDGQEDEDWVSGFCMLPKNHPTCPQEHGSTTCAPGATAEGCEPDVAGTVDQCDGVDDDCDGTIDEDTTPETCDGVDNDCDGSIDEGLINLPIRCVQDDDGDGIENGLDTDPGTFSDEFAEPDFGGTAGEIVDRGDQTVVILDPLSDEGVWVETLPSGGPNEAEISLCGGTVTLTMGPGENQVVTCPETSCLFASEQLKLLDRAEVSSDFYAGNFVLQWDAKVFANGLSTGNGNLFDRAAITGTATLAGTVTGNRGGVATLVEGAAVAEQALVAHPISVTLGVPVDIADYGTGTISPGVWGDVAVGREATLILSGAGTYTLNSLALGPETVLDLTAAGTGRVVIAVEGNVALGDELEVLGDAELDIYANGTSVVVGYDIVSLTADLQAPNANVEVRDRTVFNGCLGGRNVQIGYDAEVNGETTEPPPTEPQPPLTFWQTKTGDWGGDYCIQVGAHNPGTTAVDWIITINTNGSSITNTWNANYSGTWGTVTADPNQSYNLVIDPGETDTSVGFCAHRWAPWQTATVVAVVAE